MIHSACEIKNQLLRSSRASSGTWESSPMSPHKGRLWNVLFWLPVGRIDILLWNPRSQPRLPAAWGQAGVVGSCGQWLSSSVPEHLHSAGLLSELSWGTFFPLSHHSLQSIFYFFIVSSPQEMVVCTGVGGSTCLIYPFHLHIAQSLICFRSLINTYWVKE